MTVPALTAFAVSVPSTWLAARLAYRVGLLDHPGPRKIHHRPVPLAGGIGVAAAITAGLLTAGAEPRLLAVTWALVCVGLVDDARGLRARTRLGAQAVATLPAVLVYTPSLGAPRPLEVVVGLLWTIGVISAINCLDCSDGVAGSVTVAGALALGSLAGWSGPAGQTAAVLAAAAAAFLLFNAPPARCFLGEAGSTLLGFLLAILGLAVARAEPPGGGLAAMFAAGAVLAVPVLDFLLVHLRRFRGGCRRLADLMASAATDHLPHRLRRAGLNPGSAPRSAAARSQPPERLRFLPAGRGCPAQRSASVSLAACLSAPSGRF
ncbi:glycosyltransferase family 4 protein [Gaiella occulta]|uniref:glycosyltransferase family 4 protein n=1 Tax=Gaiella occulta TaxID=1002870 RepID=UPI0015F023B6|nr:MraY family glycosyltransferase [Gaiella occulta]